MAGCCRNRKDSSAGGIGMDEHQSGVKLEEALEAKKELDAKAQKILEEKEADSRMRTYTGPLGRAVAVLLCVWTAFQLYFTTIGAISAVNLRAIHCIFLLVFTFLLFPTFKKEKRKRKFPPLWDVAFILCSAGSFLYLILNYTRIAPDGGTYFRYGGSHCLSRGGLCF